MSLTALFGMLVRPTVHLGTAVHAVVAAVMRPRALGRLDRMDDRMLRDIGLTRQDVWSVPAEPLFRDPPIGPARWANGTLAAPRAAVRARRVRATLARLWAEDSRVA